MSKIVILATGGTIAGIADSSTSLSYKSGVVALESLLNSIDLPRGIKIEYLQFSNIGSQNIDISFLFSLRNKVQELVDLDDVKSVVITHGTDTMEESAYFLNLTVNTHKPIVLTGAMRPSNSLSADGSMNIFHSILVANYSDSRERGVMVVMNGKIHSAHAVMKSHTIAVETFVSPIRGVLGEIFNDQISFYRFPYRKHTFISEFNSITGKELSRVDIHYYSFDYPIDLLESSVKNGAKGVVIAGVGNGNFSDSLKGYLESIVEKGIVVVRATRLPNGAVIRNGEIDDDTFGFITANELSPQKARILLSLSIAIHKDDLQECFLKY